MYQEYVVFSAGFIVIHTIAYMLAGMITYTIVHKGHPIYRYYLRREEEEKELSKAMKLLLPTQLLRGLLLSLVFFPILNYMKDMSLLMNSVFLFGVLFIVGGLASQIPFPGNLEGFVYIRDQFQKGRMKFHIEDLIYCPIVAVAVSLLLI